MTIERFEAHPDTYRHWKLSVDGDVATLAMDVWADPDAQHELKLNSYDVFVDIELADAINRLRWEYPQVKAVVVTSAKDRIFCAGANIPTLAYSAHAFKVNFCKFTNETRIGFEDSSANSGQKFLCAVNGTASGGGYELALACDEILLVDDRSSVVSLPEVPLLGVLPGTGGLTRVVDKRRVRRDLADYFSSLAEGIRGKRAVEWRLVDAVAKLSKFPAAVSARARTLADSVGEKPSAGVEWTPMKITTAEDGSRKYPHVESVVDNAARVATITIKAPTGPQPSTPAEALELGVEWWPIAAFRELDDALLHLRFNQLHVGCIVLKTEGDAAAMQAVDALLDSGAGEWFIDQTRHHVKRVLKRLDNMAKTLFAFAEPGSCFVGSLFELAIAADRFFMLDDPDGAVKIGLTAMNGGAYPMGNALTRLQTRFYGEPASVGRAMETAGELIETPDADALGLVTFAPDDLDWDDEVRLALEERRSLSPDALTGMEQNLRFAGPETMETKIFGRLTAWQNWIFQRPNAVGPQGALKSFGQPTAAQFNYDRT